MEEDDLEQSYMEVNVEPDSGREARRNMARGKQRRCMAEQLCKGIVFQIVEKTQARSEVSSILEELIE